MAFGISMLTTFIIVFSVTDPIYLAQYSLYTTHVVSLTLNVNLTLFVIHCQKKIKNEHYRFTMLQLLSLPEWFFIQFQSSMTIFHDKNVRMQTIPKVDELRVSCDDNGCKLVHKKCQHKT